jgi:hypothetical protein
MKKKKKYDAYGNKQTIDSNNVIVKLLNEFLSANDLFKK